MATASTRWDFPAVRTASLALVESFGSALPGRSVAALALAQACRARGDLLSLLLRCSEPTNRFKLFVRQMQFLGDTNACDPTTVSQYQKLRRFLGERSRPWAMTDVCKPFSVLLKALPKDARVLILEVWYCLSSSFVCLFVCLFVVVVITVVSASVILVVCLFVCLFVCFPLSLATAHGCCYGFCSCGSSCCCP